MGRGAAKPKTTNVEASAPDYMAGLEIQQKFIGEALNLGWRLIVTFMVPVIIGVLLDRHFDTKPSCTLVSILFAVIASIVVIKQTVQEVNKDTAAMTKKLTKKRKKNA